MIRNLLYLLSAGAIFAIGAGTALFATPEKLTLVASDAAAERKAPPPRPPDRTMEVLEELKALRTALTAFAVSLDDAAAQRDTLQGELRTGLRESSSMIAAVSGSAKRLETAAAQVRERDARIERLVRALHTQQTRSRAEAASKAMTLRSAKAAAPAPKPARREEHGSNPIAAPALQAPRKSEPAPKKRASLAALLARSRARDVRAERTRWRLVPGHCRVGFDGTSTIHNFTAKSDAVAGTLRLNYKKPQDEPSGRIGLKVASLVSGNDDRDVEIRRHIAGERGEFPEVVVEVVAFKPPPKHAGDRYKVSAKVRFTIHGKAREVETPVTLEFTGSRLLHVTGETKLDMSSFGVRPKAKLGLIKVEDTVTVWWDLYAEVDRGR